MKKKLVNVCGMSIPLQLATHDVGKGFEHKTLQEGQTLEVDESQVTDVIRRLAKKTKARPAAIRIEDVEEAEESVDKTEDVPATGVECEVCERSFSSARGLATHMRVHEEELIAEETDNSSDDDPDLDEDTSDSDDEDFVDED